MTALTHLNLGGTTVKVDKERTDQAYIRMRSNGRKGCSCAYCENYHTQLPDLLPPPVKAFFTLAGIDPRLPAEVYQFYEIKAGLHLYGGEYYFFGEVDPIDIKSLEASHAFHISLGTPSPLIPQEFREEGAVCFEFVMPLPWMIERQP